MFDKGKKLSQRITQRTVQSSYRSQYSSGSQYSAASTRRTDFSHAKSTYGGDFAPISLDSVGEDKVRNNTLRLANKTATEAEFMLRYCTCSSFVRHPDAELVLVACMICACMICCLCSVSV